MANNNIGGFFVSLGMKVDQSFKAGEEAISRFLGITGKAVAATTGLAKVAGVVENSNLKLAKAIGISGEDLKAWQDTVSKAGVSAGAFTSSMSQLENKMQKLKLGEIDEGLAKSLGMLGIGYDQFANMDASSRVASVYKAAQAIQDQGRAAALVGEVLGSAGREYYDWLALSGSTLSEELSQSKALNYTTEESMRSAMKFNAEFNAVMNTTKSIGMLIGSKIGEKLTPVAKTVKELLRDNKEFIASGIIGVVDVLGKIGSAMGDVLMTLTGADSIKGAFQKIADGIKSFAGPAIDTALTCLKDLASAMSALWNGDWDKLGESIKSFFNDLTSGFANMVGVETEGKSASDILEDRAKAVQEEGIGVGSVVQSIAGTAAATSLALSGKDAKYNYKQGLLAKWQNEVPKGFLGVPETEKALSDFSTEFIKAYLIGVQSGAISPYENAWLNEEWRNKLSSIPVNKDASLTALTPEAKALFNEIQIGKTAGKRENARIRKTQDGIIKPDGTLTQVAPDDWVIAARNLGDVASAFMPNSVSAMAGSNTSASYVINQSFSFSGKTDSSEVMRQAYKGTQSGLMAAMNRSTQRLQLMPGLR